MKESIFARNSFQDLMKTFIDSVLFTDESSFECNVVINKQNDRIWHPIGRGRPPNANFQVKNFPKKVMVWAGFTSKFLIGPYFFDNPVNSSSYQEMINTCVVSALKSKRKYSTVIFQQDGATPHTAAETKDLLKHHFSENRVISRGFAFQWPGYSPDLTPADFGLWPYIKSKVNIKNYSNVSELKVSIEEEFEKIEISFLQNCVYSVLDRCELCLNSNGGIF